MKKKFSAISERSFWHKALVYVHQFEIDLEQNTRGIDWAAIYMANIERKCVRAVINPTSIIFQSVNVYSLFF